MNRDQDPKNVSEFESIDSDSRQPTIAEEFWLLVRENKKWWMIPIFVVLGLLGALAILGATGAAPFIYTMF